MTGHWTEPSGFFRARRLFHVPGVGAKERMAWSRESWSSNLIRPIPGRPGVPYTKLSNANRPTMKLGVLWGTSSSLSDLQRSSRLDSRPQ